MPTLSHRSSIVCRSGFLLATGLSFSVSYAAGPDAGSLMQQQLRSMPKAAERLPQAEAVPPELLSPKTTAGQKVTIKAVRFTGAQGLATEDDLQSVVRGVINKPQGFAELEQLADAVTRFLKDKGWLLARAYLPQQDLTDGLLEIVIVQGRIESDDKGLGIDINSADTLRVSRDRILLTLSHALNLSGDRALHAADLERGILLINDTPGLEATSSLERGRTPGTTRLALEVRNMPLYNGSVWVDNYGNRYTGTARANVMANINSPAGMGDQINIFYTKAEGVDFGRLDYSLPLGYSGLRANVGASSMQYAIGKDQAAQQSKGTGDIASAGLSYPLVRGRGHNLNFSANYDHKRLQDETLGNNTRDKELNNWTLSLSGDRTDTWLAGGISNYSIGVTHGKLDLSRNATDFTNDAVSNYTHGSFNKWSASMTRLQRLADTLTLFVGVSGQRAGKNLDTSEKFILGGASGVRAYPGGEGSGDHGWLANIELRKELQALRQWGLGDFQLVGFYDHGGITLQHSPNPVIPANNPTQTNRYQLSGVGLGLNLTSPGRYSVRMAWGQPLGDNDGRDPRNNNNSDGKSKASRVWLSATFNF